MREHVDRDAVVGLTRDLVRLDTRNPPGDERKAADACRAALEPFGATFSEVEPSPGRTSLIATVGAGDGSRPTLVVNGHLDVVPINEADWTRAPFGGDLEQADGGERMYGRGTADMKGGIAAAIEALATLRRAGVEPACDVVFHLVADEERGGRLGTKVLVEEGLVVGVDACLVPEPTGMEVCVAERGLLVAHYTTIGRAAHGSNPRNGVSAIETAAKVVLALHAADYGDVAHPLLGAASANVGVIAGGSGHNTVAETCRITLDRRLLPGATLEGSLATIAARIDAIDDPDLRWEVEVETYGEASAMDPEDPFAAQVGAVLEGVLGRRPGIIGMPFTTDARFVRNQAGIPAVVCGPGEISQAHVADEWVAVDALVDATACFAALYAAFTRPA